MKTRLPLVILSLVAISVLPSRSIAQTYINFAAIPDGGSIEGLGTVHPNVDIESTSHTGEVQRPGGANSTYGAGPTNSLLDGFIDPNGGFADTGTPSQQFGQAFNISLVGVSATAFSLRMLDYGDYNPYGSTVGTVTLEALNSLNTVVDSETLVSNGPEGGTGDASDPPGELGNFTFNLSGLDIADIAFLYTNDGTAGFPAGIGNSAPLDPNIAFDSLNFTFTTSSASAPEPGALLLLLGPAALCAPLLRRRSNRARAVTVRNMS